MVERHHPSRPEPIVVKRGRRRSVLRQEHPHCVVCGAELRGDHAVGDLVCDCHPRDGGNPRCDSPQAMLLTPEERLLVMLYRAEEQPLNVYRAFACDSTNTNTAAFRDLARRLNRRLGTVSGHHHVGYKLASKRQG